MGGIGLKRQMDALLRLSLSASKIHEPLELARVALAEVVSILHGERALLFLISEKTGKPDLIASCNTDGTSLQNVKDFSTSVVCQVQEFGQPIVVGASSKEGKAVSLSESAQHHGLRSIMAAPLIIRDKPVGVIYIDTRLAKGVFTAENVDILTAMANQLAISLETAKSARLEIERTALEKDIAVSATVQTLFLPREPSFNSQEISIAGHYKPAALCGGDWWWYQPHSNGKLLFLIGDVTGHGVGSAMVTAIIASSYQTMKEIGQDQNVPRLLEVLNKNLTQICENKYFMTFAVVELDPVARKLKYWNAGHPPVFLIKGDSSVEALIARGAPLGLVSSKLGH